MNPILDYKHAARASEARKNKVIAYAHILSSTGKGTWTVVRYKDRSYSCNCPDRMFRFPKKCKHIRAFEAHEVVLKLARDIAREERRKKSKKG